MPRAEDCHRRAWQNQTRLTCRLGRGAGRSPRRRWVPQAAGRGADREIAWSSTERPAWAAALIGVRKLACDRATAICDEIAGDASAILTAERTSTAAKPTPGPPRIHRWRQRSTSCSNRRWRYLTGCCRRVSSRRRSHKPRLRYVITRRRGSSRIGASEAHVVLSIARWRSSAPRTERRVLASRLTRVICRRHDLFRSTLGRALEPSDPAHVRPVKRAGKRRLCPAPTSAASVDERM